MLLQESPHVLVVWRPDLHSYTAHITKEVNSSGPANSKMNNADLPKIVGQGLGKAIQLWQEDVHVRLELLAVTSCDTVGACLPEHLIACSGPQLCRTGSQLHAVKCSGKHAPPVGNYVVAGNS